MSECGCVGEKERVRKETQREIEWLVCAWRGVVGFAETVEALNGRLVL